MSTEGGGRPLEQDAEVGRSASESTAPSASFRDLIKGVGFSDDQKRRLERAKEALKDE